MREHPQATRARSQQAALEQAAAERKRTGLSQKDGHRPVDVVKENRGADHLRGLSWIEGWPAENGGVRRARRRRPFDDGLELRIAEPGSLPALEPASGAR